MFLIIELFSASSLTASVKSAFIPSARTFSFFNVLTRKYRYRLSALYALDPISNYHLNILSIYIYIYMYVCNIYIYIYPLHFVYVYFNLYPLIYCSSSLKITTIIKDNIYFWEIIIKIIVNIIICQTYMFCVCV